ncbi:hypothetical protein EO93_02370 [Methanosarcina sp. 1.H.A.2.2]|nr:hypothetical protein EO93_02370 [Methanosarcina sp. 1.H.A.2.2]
MDDYLLLIKLKCLLRNYEKYNFKLLSLILSLKILLENLIIDPLPEYNLKLFFMILKLVNKQLKK